MTIDVQNVTVRFGGVVAVDDVSLKVERGQIVSIVGPNGSGKSTMFNAITGMVRATAGSVRLDGKTIDRQPAHKRIGMGLARTFQTPRFDPTTTVFDAVMCGFYPVKKAWLFSSMLRTPAASREERDFQNRCEAILEDLRLSEFRDLQMSELPMGRVRLVEVGRAVANEPKYILLDEPAAGLARDEQRMLAAEVRRLAERGVGVLLVEHNFNLIRELAEHVVVLKEGAMLLEGTPAEISRDPVFIDTYLGRSG